VFVKHDAITESEDAFVVADMLAPSLSNSDFIGSGTNYSILLLMSFQTAKI
jgi:hypothetical protein